MSYTEPTPFGLNDLVGTDMIRELGIPHGVVVNRAEDVNWTRKVSVKSGR